jgi:exosortase A-associated hydrolase 1
MHPGYSPEGTSRPATEEALAFRCGGETLAGILHRPANATDNESSGAGVIVVVGGPQYRVGSHRQFVHLARALAAAGHPVLRFDASGMGDSTGELRGFEQISDEIAAAIDALQRCQPGLHKVILWGLCDGASAALLYLHERADPRVGGLCLLNPWVRSQVSQARTQVKQYYRERLLQKAFWIKLATGRVGADALSGFVGSLRRALRGDGPLEVAPTFQRCMAEAWRAFPHPILLMLSERDFTAKEFIDHVETDRAWSGALQQRTLQRVELGGADHTCSTAAARRAVESNTMRWMSHIASAKGAQTC